MALNEHQKRNLEQARYESEFSFISDASKIPMQSNPTLIIGLGGTGIDALLRVKAKVNQTFIASQDSETRRKKTAPDNIRFLALDTDRKTLSIEKAGPNRDQELIYSYQGMRVEHSEAIYIGADDFGSYKADRDHLSPYITEWLSNHLGPLADTKDGAGGMRQVSRLLVFRNADKIFSQLKQAVDQLLRSVTAEHETMSVFILTGVSGGTGSGTYLDIAYLLQKAILEVGAGNRFARAETVFDIATITAYLFLPDISKLNCNQAFIEFNGYAALKELDYLMGLKLRKETFDQVYSGSIEVHSECPPFSLVHLVSSHFISGGPVEKAYDKALIVTAESIAYWLARESSTAGGYASLTPNGYYANVTQAIESMTGKLNAANTLETVGYLYGIVGASAKMLPVRDIMLCLCHALFQEVDKAWLHRDPNTQQVQAAMGRARMNLGDKDLAAMLCARTHPLSTIRTQPYAKYETVTGNNGQSLHNAYNQALQRNTSIIKSNFSDEFVQGIKDKVRSELQLLFVNRAPALTEGDAGKFGPAFANSILVGALGSTNLNLRKHCKQMYDFLTDKISIADLQSQQIWPDIASKLDRAKNTAFHKKAYFADFLDVCEQYYQLRQDVVLFDTLRTLYQLLEEFVLELNHKIFETIALALQALKEIFEHNTEVMGDVQIRQSHEGAVLDWSVLPNFNDVKNEVKEMLEQADIHVVAEEFYTSIWEQQDRWISEDAQGYDVFSHIVEFIGGQFNTQLHRGLEEYLKRDWNAHYKGKGKTFDEYVQQILVPDLEGKAEILFLPNKTALRALNDAEAPKRTLVQIPKDCTTIITDIDAVRNQRGNNDRNRMDISSTRNSSQITWNSMMYGVPLYAYGMLEQLERAYEQVRDNIRVNGCHIYLPTTEGGARDWTKLPALLPQRYASSTYANLSENKRKTTLTQLFDEALGYGVIRRREGNVLRATLAATKPVNAHISDELPVDTFLAEKESDLVAAGSDLKSHKKLLTELRSYLDIEKDLPLPAGTIPVDLYHGESPDNEVAKRWFLASYDLAMKVEADCERYRNLLHLIAQTEEAIIRIENSSIASQAILRAFWTETIRFEDGKYFYYPAMDGLDPVLLAKKSEIAEYSFAAGYPEYALFYHMYIRGNLKEKNRKFLEQDAKTRFTELEEKQYALFQSKGLALRSKIKKAVEKLERQLDDPDGDELEMQQFYQMADAYLANLVELEDD